MPKRTRRFDDDDLSYSFPHRPTHQLDDLRASGDVDDEPDAVPWSTYHADGVVHGPSPCPPWVLTSSAATDTDLGVLKTGKEAEVSLVRRELDGAVNLLAAKRYRSADHRLFHRDAAYLEGRKERKSRERRAMATRTDFGRELIATRWAQAEFDVLCRLASVGAAVPYPVQLLGTELMMEFIGDADGTAAPRLAQVRPTTAEVSDLWHQLTTTLRHLAVAGFAHGDLSAYNVLVHDGRLVIIDVPQAVDLVGNPRAEEFLHRDCANVAGWFVAHGLDVDGSELAVELLSLSRGDRPDSTA